MKKAYRSSDEVEIDLITGGHHLTKYRNEDFVRAYVRKVYVTAKMMEECLNTLNEIAGNNKIKLLVDPNDVKGISREARLMLGNPAELKVSKMAVIAANLLTITVSRMMSEIDCPEFKFKTFKNYVEAIEWLNKA